MDIKLKLRMLIGKYRDFFDKIIEEHKAIRDHIGHGIDHALMVAQYGLLIAENPRTGELAWIAGLLHNIDRVSLDYDRKIDDIVLLLPQEITDMEIVRIKHAVNHHTELNKADDDDVLITLKDADRLANVGPLNLIRGGQHHRDIPATILGVFGLNSESTFKHPISVLDCIYYNLEWEEMLRSPKAKVIGKKQFDYYRDFMVRNREQFAEVGLDEWPLDI
jgi:hypothetical protein